eukprot:5486292-Pleurochrysis_carterae.AAC.1
MRSCLAANSFAQIAPTQTDRKCKHMKALARVCAHAFEPGDSDGLVGVLGGHVAVRRYERAAERAEEARAARCVQHVRAGPERGEQRAQSRLVERERKQNRAGLLRQEGGVLRANGFPTARHPLAAIDLHAHTTRAANAESKRAYSNFKNELVHVREDTKAHRNDILNNPQMPA